MNKTNKNEHKTNHLSGEKSPYLLQHAYNPVDWYPWGDEAFTLAKNENKPVFLSIGYSTCHWCHVMERESFEDEKTADLINKAFVPVKVDREERPDIDTQYMKVCQLMTGQGGWPLTILMTPDKRPFFAGTYIPRESHGNRMGLKELVATVSGLWKNQKEDLRNTAEQIVSKISTLNESRPPLPLEARALHRGYLQLQGAFDPEHAGFGTFRKFPTPHNLLFLLRHWNRSGEPQALEMVQKTLDAMILGGIHDHVGGGFHRYSTDRLWKLPHFEKMLYDQALMAIALLETYSATKEARYADTARNLFTYVQRELESPRGGFYTAQDADTEGEEGRFYIWTLKELREHFSKQDVKLLVHVFNLEERGNFQDEADGKYTGGNVLHRTQPAALDAEALGLSEEELKKNLDRLTAEMHHLRNKRTPPATDDKILTDLNGLMIAAFARGARVLGDADLALTARKGAEFIWRELREQFQPEGETKRAPSLLHRWRDGEASIPGFLDDYAFLTWGLTELYEATFDPEWLRRALDLTGRMEKLFADREHGGYFTTREDGETILTRSKEFHDGAVPSGNSVAAHALLRLSRLTGRSELEMSGRRVLEAASAEICGAPAHHTFALLALSHLLGPSFDVVVAGNSDADDTLALLEPLAKEYFPHAMTLFRPTDESVVEELTAVAPFTEHYDKKDGHAAAYVCRDGMCELPTTDPQVMRKHLHAGSRAAT